MDQQSIIEVLGVAPTFDAAIEVERRSAFLVNYLRTNGAKAYVLGISGGVDSLTAGLMAQRAVKRLRETGQEARFIAVRLPYGIQKDEVDAQACLDVIKPDRTVTVDIKPAADAMFASVLADAGDLVDDERFDFLLGNVKARQRMIAQYALAGAVGGLVIGTDHAAEAVMGFFTKFGDGAADVVPLSGLNKRRVRAIAAMLGAPENLVYKVPTADLESDAPLRPDEDAYGVTYDQIDDFLEGKAVDDPAKQIILRAYRTTAHKRVLPVGP
jgi:NAD+ synthase